MASTELETIDTGWRHEPIDAPSARFGWHGLGRKSAMIAGWFSVIALFAMLIGNHRGHVEDIYLVVIALGVAFLLVKQTVGRRGRWAK